jgi:predicted small integral membrane protein
MLRIVKIMLILSVAMWAFLGAFGNIKDWGGTTAAVSTTTSMSTFKGGADDWRATTNPVAVLLGASFILFSKVVVGCLCLVGAWRMWTARAGDSATFARAKVLAITGCAYALFMLFTGWVVIADTWFELWRSGAFGHLALETAFCYGGMIALIGLLVGARDD